VIRNADVAWAMEALLGSIEPMRPRGFALATQMKTGRLLDMKQPAACPKRELKSALNCNKRMTLISRSWVSFDEDVVRII
jgi:hypothetical protein